jgi:hypothetical protein
MMATTLLVVPRSMPMILPVDMVCVPSALAGWPRARTSYATAVPIGLDSHNVL